MCQLLLCSLLFGQTPYDLHTQNEYSYGIRIDWSIDPSVEPTAYNIYKDGEYHHTKLPQWNGLFTSYIYSNSSSDNIDKEYCFTVTPLYGKE